MKAKVKVTETIENYLESIYNMRDEGKQEGGDLNVRVDLPRLSVTKDKVSGEKIALDATLPIPGSVRRSRSTATRPSPTTSRSTGRPPATPS